ncbi:histidine kinase [Lederbergia ruris]|uniref:histidine kinase n=1 Tax=Lederbergia ruris TaxID=217495 RepID=A0ABQ4KFR8_9BACI|nr:sensor histidine kinase [Lederbergia ruris]GIN56825.1 histidine kinase [Lederbergia ruris]
MNRFYKKLTFRSKLRLAFIFLVTISVSFTGWITYYITADLLQDNALKMNQEMLNKSSQALDEKLKQFPKSLMLLFVSDSYKDLMKDVAIKDNSRYSIHYSGLQTVFTQLTLNDELLESILLVTPIGDFYLADDARTGTEFKETNIYKRLQKNKHAIWIEGHKDPFFFRGNSVVSFVLPAIGDRVDIEDCYIVLNIKADKLNRFVISNINESQGGVTVVNEKGNPIFPHSPFQYNQLIHLSDFIDHIKTGDERSFEYDHKGKHYLVNFAKSKVNHKWTLISVKPKHKLLEQARTIKWTTTAVTLGAIILAIIISNVFIKVLMRPLIQLQSLMKRAGQNDLSVRFSNDSNDEVTQVGLQFNQMMEQIRQLIRHVKNAEKEKYRAEIKALQVQIVPHFLYNTLNTIYWKSTLHKEKDVQEMVMALSRMFRLGLNSGKEITTVEKEIAHVTQYLNIQQKCYENLFTYRIDVDEESAIRDQPILKLILQPLVENSINHGFKDKREGGFIEIRLSRKNDWMCITVSDNGVGMDTEMVQRNIEQENDAYKGFALYNIFQRIQLYYENKAEMKLESTPGVGTTVKLSIPWMEAKKDEG